MKALVTGANGFTGSHLVRSLIQRGYEVVGLVRPTSNLSRLAETGIQLVYGDVTDRAALKTAMTGVDQVFHIAAYVDLGLVNAAEMERVNVQGTAAVLAIAQELRATTGQPTRLVYCSTIGIYGDTQGQAIDETFQRTQVGFSSAYDRTKYQAQQLVDAAAQAGLPIVSLMPAGILGADDPHFGPVFKLYLSGRLKFWPGGDRVTGVVHVDDLVEALILAAEKSAPGEHYIISAGDLTTREMFTVLSQVTGVPVPAEPPRWLVRSLGTLLDPIGRLLRWNPPLSRERVHYIYDRCVQVKAIKAQQVLGWQPRSVPTLLQELAQDLRPTDQNSR